MYRYTYCSTTILFLLTCTWLDLLVDQHAPFIHWGHASSSGATYPAGRRGILGVASVWWGKTPDAQDILRETNECVYYIYIYTYMLSIFCICTCVSCLCLRSAKQTLICKFRKTLANGRSFGTKIPYSKVFGGSWMWATPICQSNLSFWPDFLKDARVKDLRLCQLGLMLPGWRATRHKIYSDHNLSSASPYQRWSVVNTCKGMSKPLIFLHQLVCCKLPRYVPPSIYTNDIQFFLRVKTCQANQFFPQVSSCWYQVVPSYIIHWSSKLPKN